jgi:hypothetical protein
MAIPAALMLAGTAMQIAGQWASNSAAAAQEKINAAFYREQAVYARQSAMRAEASAEFDYTTKIGMQMGAFAASGVELSGSAAVTVAGTLKNSVDEIWAIKRKGDMDVQLASMRGELSADRARTLGSVGYNLMQGATIGISNYAASEGFGGGFPTFFTGTNSGGNVVGSQLGNYFNDPGRNAYQGYNLGNISGSN